MNSDFVEALASDADAERVPSPLVGEGQGGG
jgi:hypothetical protein